MSKLVRPREIQQRKQSLRKDSNAKKSEMKAMMSHLVSSREYAHIKRIAAGIASSYRTAPGATREQNESYLTHCTILWAYNMMWKAIEDMAKVQPRSDTEDDDQGW